MCSPDTPKTDTDVPDKKPRILLTRRQFEELNGTSPLHVSRPSGSYSGGGGAPRGGNGTGAGLNTLRLPFNDGLGITRP